MNNGFKNGLTCLLAVYLVTSGHVLAQNVSPSPTMVPGVVAPPTSSSPGQRFGPAGAGPQYVVPPGSDPQLVDMAMAMKVPRTYPRPPSEWQESEKAVYEKLLSTGKFDVMVAPLQVQGWALDRSTRSAMAAEIAQSLEHSLKQHIADPHLVARALGDGQRAIKPFDVYRLADRLGVRRVVWGTVGHDGKGKMNLTFSSQDRVDSSSGTSPWAGPKVSKKFDNVAISDESPAIQVFESLLPDLLKGLGVPPLAPSLHITKADAHAVRLPNSPRDLVGPVVSPARDASTFLLYGLLTPQYLERTKERFAEKALVALMSLSPASPDYRALRARTFMAMGLRPAAIAQIGTPGTDEERELLAALNGNLPQVRALAAKEKDPIKALMQKLDENKIASSYGLLTKKGAIDAAASLKLPGTSWPFLVSRAFVDWDEWSQFENGALKLLLDQELPVKGYALQDLPGGGVVAGDRAKLQGLLDLSIGNHARKLIDGDAVQWMRDGTFRRPGKLDYLELLSAIGHDNLIRRISFLANVQGRPDSAIAFANSIDAVYKGFPYYAMERSRAELRQAKNSGGIESDGLRKVAHDHAFNALFWEQGQSQVSDMAQDVIKESHLQPYGYHDNIYASDIPFRPYFWTWTNGSGGQTTELNSIAALKNATHEFNAFSHLASFYRQLYPGAPREKALLASIGERFIGSPQRNELLGKLAFMMGDAEAGLKLFRENIQLVPDYWQSYETLGKQLVELGRVAEAQKVFLSYPGFRKNSGANRVGIANEAFEAGSYFFWMGHPDLAKPLYEISASQNTGAASEISSRLRLRLLVNDIDGAAAGSLERGQRYNDSYGYRDFIGILHAKGQSKTAWEGFNALVRASQSPHVWETALVGHHMAATSESDVMKWAGQGELKEAGPNKNAAAMYLARFATTDRTPSRELAEAINTLDQPVWKLEGPQGTVVRQTEEDPSGSILGPNNNGTARVSLPIGMFDRSKKSRVKSDLAYFVQAYRAIRLKDYPAAKAVFDEAASLYDLSGYAAYMLPYYAFAAATVGDTAKVEKTLSSVQPADQRFDFYLAKAALAGVGGKAEEALQSLSLARYRRPHTEGRPLLTQFTLADIAELVSESSRNPKIQALTLDWAKKCQLFEPWHSWSYALEAKLAKSPADRNKALGMLHYLDPRSERLSSFSKADIDAAVKAFAGQNPFLSVATKGSSKGAI
jgi:hypothetical protein